MSLELRVSVPREVPLTEASKMASCPLEKPASAEASETPNSSAARPSNLIAPFEPVSLAVKEISLVSLD